MYIVKYEMPVIDSLVTLATFYFYADLIDFLKHYEVSQPVRFSRITVFAEDNPSTVFTASQLLYL